MLMADALKLLRHPGGHKTQPVVLRSDDSYAADDVGVWHALPATMGK